MGWDRGSRYQGGGGGGGQKDPSFPKTHPCAQGASHTFGRAGSQAPLGLVGGTWGWDWDLGFRFSSLLALCTPAKVHSLLGLTFLIYKMGVMNVLLTLLDRCGIECCGGYSITPKEMQGERGSGEDPGVNSE